jgi:hypothetical protein
VIAKYYDHRGSAYFDKGMYSEALIDHSKAISLEAGEAMYYYHRGNAMLVRSSPTNLVF